VLCEGGENGGRKGTRIGAGRREEKGQYVERKFRGEQSKNVDSRNSPDRRTEEARLVVDKLALLAVKRR
jgi:hypothetical protein